VGTYEEASVFD
jgi:hypothetical protein